MESKELSEALEEAQDVALEAVSELESMSDGMTSAADLVRLAQFLVQTSRDISRLAAEATDDKYAERYMVDQLSCLADDSHHFLCGDFNFDKWLERLEGEDEEGEEVE